jgi:hypothetical protein
VRTTLRFVWVLAIILAVLALYKAVHAAQPSPSAPNISSLAPADEYFGRQRISVVRIHHQVFALKDDLHHQRRRPDAIQHEADSIGDAYFDWANRFPQDRWLPRMGWELATLYEELPGYAAQGGALAMLAFIEQHYGDTPSGRASAQDLLRGVGLRAWPRWAGRAPSQPLPLAGAVAVPNPSDAQAVQAAVQNVAAGFQAKQLSPAAAFGATAVLEEIFRGLPAAARNLEMQQRCAWELAALYELLPGIASRDRAIRMLALVLDRYGNTQYGLWSLRDLQRGVGVRS